MSDDDDDENDVWSDSETGGGVIVRVDDGGDDWGDDWDGDWDDDWDDDWAYVWKGVQMKQRQYNNRDIPPLIFIESISIRPSRGGVVAVNPLVLNRVP